MPLLLPLLCGPLLCGPLQAQQPAHLRCCPSVRSYGPQWEAHVLSNLPFYLTLLPLFLEASVPRVEVRPAACACLWLHRGPGLRLGCLGRPFCPALTRTPPLDPWAPPGAR